MYVYVSAQAVEIRGKPRFNSPPAKEGWPDGKPRFNSPPAKEGWPEGTGWFEHSEAIQLCDGWRRKNMDLAQRLASRDDDDEMRSNRMNQN